MSKSVLFDSSVWIAWLTKGDLHHFKAKRIIGRYIIKKYQIIVPIIVLVEVIAFLSRNRSSKQMQIDQFVDEVKTTENFILTELSIDETVKIAKLLAKKVSLKAFDYYIVIYCYYLKPSKFESFDKRLTVAYNGIT